MNQNQKRLLIGIVIVMLGMLLYPPFYGTAYNGVTINFGYGFIFEPPNSIALVNSGVLFVQMVAAAVIGFVGWYLLKEDMKSSSGDNKKSHLKVEINDRRSSIFERLGSWFGSKKSTSSVNDKFSTEKKRDYFLIFDYLAGAAGGQFFFKYIDSFFLTSPWMSGLASGILVIIGGVVGFFLSYLFRSLIKKIFYKKSVIAAGSILTSLCLSFAFLVGVAIYSKTAGNFHLEASVPTATSDQSDAKSQIINPGDGMPSRTDVAVLPQNSQQRFLDPFNGSDQNEIGLQYLTGQGGKPKDITKAVQWFSESAENGDANGQYNLGMLYLNGTGLSQDDVQAAIWFRKAADQGSADSQFKLGLMYGEGRGLQQDYDQATKWYFAAADQGHAKAQTALGFTLSFRDKYPQAIMWLAIAKANGENSADAHLRRVVANATPQQIDEANRMMSAWWATRHPQK